MSPLGRHILTWLTAMLFAVASVVSASAMAPDRSEPMRIAFVAATGGSDADICGGEGISAFHCPVCHGLDAPPSATAPDTVFAIWFANDADLSADLVPAPCPVSGANLVRAPPSLG